MKSVLVELSHWANTLPYWEQAALDRIVSGTNFVDSDYDELLQYLLEDANLNSSVKPRPSLHFSKYSSADFQSTVPVRLIKISNLQNINALVSEQTLTFDSAITAIYGGNGSGKSGYARVLGCAGFSRGDQEVLPDVTRPTDKTVVLSANIEIQESSSNRVIQYQIGKQCPKLSSFYVFDSTSVHVHLTESNSFSFSQSVDIITHWIKRGDDGKPGYVFLNNSPALEREYRKPTRALEIYERTKKASAEEQEALLRDGFGALRTAIKLSPLSRQKFSLLR
ncbi:MAG: AAA family ATPase [Syntrophaceae bacterium]|nr:AAA family ATPase [Syntrophaceae bacterium]